MKIPIGLRSTELQYNWSLEKSAGLFLSVCKSEDKQRTALSGLTKFWLPSTFDNPTGQPVLAFFCSNTIFLEKNLGVFFIFFIQSQVSAAWAASPVLILHPTFRWQCKPQTLPPPNVFVRKVSELKLDKIAKCFHSDNPGLFISINQNRIFLLLTQYISAPPCLFPRPDKYISGDTVLR